MVSGSSEWLDKQDAAASDQPQINWNEDGVTPIARLTATGANLVASMSWGEGRLTYHSLVSAPTRDGPQSSLSKHYAPDFWIG